MNTAVAEKVFFDVGGVKVTNARFIVNQQTYAMASVSSVKVSSTDRTPSKSGAVWTCIFGALSLAASFGVTNDNSWLSAIGGIVLLAVGIIWYRSIKPKFEYKLILTTSSGENTALTSFDLKDIRRVEHALNEAVIFRG